jgi:D-xylose transport system permease protein
MASDDVAKTEAPGPALTEAELRAAAPEVLASNLSEYFKAWGQRIRNGESGALPVLAGLVAIGIFFQLEQGQFLSSQNLVNLLVEAAIFVMFGAAEAFVLLLSEIDLSIGFGAAVGAFITCELIAAPDNFPWWVGVLGGLAVMAILGFVQGSLITRLGLPSFVVTLGGSLFFEGLMLDIAGKSRSSVGGVINISNSSPIYKLVNSRMSTSLDWAVMVVVVILFAGAQLLRARSRRANGLTAAPLGVTVLTIALAAVGGIVLLLICNSNQSLGLTVIQGVPWVIPFVLIVLGFYSWLLARTRTGRYIYAIGANPEAARRAGINVKRIVTFCFVMSSVTAGLAGIIYASNQGSMSTDIDGGQYVLFAVAAAVIGGTSLFGGRGKMWNALLGGIIIATVYNGLALMTVGTDVDYMVTAIVLVAAVTLDSLVRRRALVR